MKELCYALFHCNPHREPPFTLELGVSDGSIANIEHCEHIPDAMNKLEVWCGAHAIGKSGQFTLLYPIYLSAMDTDDEATMHQVASLIKAQADRRAWKFDRIDGHTGKTRASFLPSETAP